MTFRSFGICDFSTKKRVPVPFILSSGGLSSPVPCSSSRPHSFALDLAHMSAFGPLSRVLRGGCLPVSGGAVASAAI